MEKGQAAREAEWRCRDSDSQFTGGKATAELDVGLCSSRLQEGTWVVATRSQTLWAP